jgi:methionyl-tRNA formyltransferase
MRWANQDRLDDLKIPTRSVKMKILFLGPNHSPLIEWLRTAGEDVESTEDPINLAFLDKKLPEFIISYGYRHLIRQNILDHYIDKVINLHVSYLPWNRGADPNLWSFIEGTPKGVTIHYIDAGMDTGDIIVQREVEFSENETLRSSYEQLQTEIQMLFQESWPEIRSGYCNRTKQKEHGTHHRLKDKLSILHRLPDGWDTPVSVLKQYAHETQGIPPLKQES